MANYTVTIKETSKKDLSKREQLLLKDTSNAVKLDVAAEGAPFIIAPVAYAILGVHNEKSENKDYENYLILDREGEKFVTGSKSFWNSFIDIFDEMLDENGNVEDFEIEVYKRDSRNYSGKKFLTCSII